MALPFLVAIQASQSLSLCVCVLLAFRLSILVRATLFHSSSVVVFSLLSAAAAAGDGAQSTLSIGDEPATDAGLAAESAVTADAPLPAGAGSSSSMLRPSLIMRWMRSA